MRAVTYRNDLARNLMFFISLLLCYRAFAANCQLGMHARCLSCNDQEFICDNGLQGYAKSSLTPDEISIVVHTPNGSTLNYELNKPAHNLNSFYGDLTKNSEVISFLRNQAGVEITPGMRVDLGDVFFRKPPKLSKTAKGESEVDSTQAPGDETKLRCLYDHGSANAIKSSACSGTQICVGPVTCTLNSKLVVKGRNVGYRMKAGVCPSASDCAADAEVSLVNAPTSSDGDLSKEDLSHATGSKGVVQ